MSFISADGIGRHFRVHYARYLTQQPVSVEQVGQVISSERRFHHSLGVLRFMVLDSVPLRNCEVVRICESVVDCKKRNCLVVTRAMCHVQKQDIGCIYIVADSCLKYQKHLFGTCPGTTKVRRHYGKCRN